MLYQKYTLPLLAAVIGAPSIAAADSFFDIYIDIRFENNGSTRGGTPPSSNWNVDSFFDVDYDIRLTPPSPKNSLDGLPPGEPLIRTEVVPPEALEPTGGGAPIDIEIVALDLSPAVPINIVRDSSSGDFNIDSFFDVYYQGTVIEPDNSSFQAEVKFSLRDNDASTDPEGPAFNEAAMPTSVSSQDPGWDELQWSLTRTDDTASPPFSISGSYSLEGTSDAATMRITLVPVPEPGTYLLLGSSLLIAAPCRKAALKKK